MLIAYWQSEQGAAETVAAIEATGSRAVAIRADLTQEAEVARMLDTAVVDFGRVDTLVANSGGLLQRSSVADCTLALWQEAFPLPEAIIEEIKRVADRVEIRFAEVTLDALPAAALVESPIYRGGEQLQPWQRAFVTMFLKHRDTYGKARLLLADEVGLGKTLSSPPAP